MNIEGVGVYLHIEKAGLPAVDLLAVTRQRVDPRPENSRDQATHSLK